MRTAMTVICAVLLASIACACAAGQDDIRQAVSNHTAGLDLTKPMDVCIEGCVVEDVPFYSFAKGENGERGEKKLVRTVHYERDMKVMVRAGGSAYKFESSKAGGGDTYVIGQPVKGEAWGVSNGVQKNLATDPDMAAKSYAARMYSALVNVCSMAPLAQKGPESLGGAEAITPGVMARPVVVEKSEAQTVEALLAADKPELVGACVNISSLRMDCLFSDFRKSSGLLFPMSWQLSRPGQPANVKVTVKRVSILRGQQDSVFSKDSK